LARSTQGKYPRAIAALNQPRAEARQSPERSVAHDRENSPRWMRLISPEERAYPLGSQIRVIQRSQQRLREQSTQKIMCASVKAP